jgi:predicted Zn finger-like uncharacterized protein
MRITCPSCSTAYDVPDSLMTAGRAVRCARCGGEWAPVAVAVAAPEPEPEAAEPPPVAATPPPVATPRPSAMERLAAHAAWPQPSNQLRLAWVGSLVVLLLAIGAAYVWRGQIVAEWPPSARAYAVFGLQPQTEPPR